MQIDTLRIFAEVANARSFAAVARQRGADPSSISRLIGQLEEELGVRLLQRSTREMSLTEAGEIFLRRTAGVLEEMAIATDEVRRLDAKPTGTLRLTASTAFGERIIAPLLPAYRARYPALELELLFTDANLDLVAESIDIAVRMAPRLTGDLVVTRLMTTRYLVCAAPSYLEHARRLRRPEDLAAHPCVRFTFPAFRSGWTFRKRRGGRHAAPTRTVSVSGAVSSSSALTVRSLAIQGAGPALLADWLVRDDLAEGRLVRLFPGFEATATDFDTAAWLAYPSRRFLPQRVRVTIDFLKESLASPD